MLKNLHANEAVKQGELCPKERNSPSGKYMLFQYLVYSPVFVVFTFMYLIFHIHHKQGHTLHELDHKKDTGEKVWQECKFSHFSVW